MEASLSESASTHQIADYVMERYSIGEDSNWKVIDVEIFSETWTLDTKRTWKVSAFLEELHFED